MKRYLATYPVVLAFVNLAFLLVAAAVRYRLNLTYPFVLTEAGALLAAAFVTLGVRILRREKGRPVVNAVLGYLALLPAVVVLRVVFSLAVFRFTFVVWVVALVAGVAYAAGVAVVSARGRKEAERLNALLAERDAPSGSK